MYLHSLHTSLYIILTCLFHSPRTFQLPPLHSQKATVGMFTIDRLALFWGLLTGGWDISYITLLGKSSCTIYDLIRSSSRSQDPQAIIWLYLNMFQPTLCMVGNSLLGSFINVVSTQFWATFCWVAEAPTYPYMLHVLDQNVELKPCI